MLRVFVIFHWSSILSVSVSTPSRTFCSEFFKTTVQKSQSRRCFHRCRDLLHRRLDSFHGLYFPLRITLFSFSRRGLILQISSYSNRTWSSPGYEDSFSRFPHSRFDWAR